MFRIITEIKEKITRKQEPDVREGLDQLMDKLNEVVLDAILAYDMALDLQMKMDGDE